MKLVIFGLSISSSWGNGHATLWRGLCRALSRRGHYVVFFERDAPYYAAHRDFVELPGGRLVLYSEWSEMLEESALDELESADVAIVTSYCPDAVSAASLIQRTNALPVFYDLDSPVTLSRIESGETVDYIPANGLRDFELVLSYTGGEALAALKEVLGARAVAPLYGSVDPDRHRPEPGCPEYTGHLSYLGTYARDRQAALEELFVEPARMRDDLRFIIGGAQYPSDFPWAGISILSDISRRPSTAGFTAPPGQR